MNATQYDPGPAEAGAGELVPRATIEAIVKQRNTALALYGQAHTALMNASDASTAAHDASRKINPNADGHRFNHHLHHDKEAFMTVGKPQSRDDYMKVAARIVDTEAWSHIVAITDLERLMDKQAKGELYQSLLGNPPEATVENIRATLQQFILDADTIFQRGIANCFSKLERRFRSHDGFKIGSRVVLTGMYDGFGFRNSSRDMESTLLDIERTFMVLDGKAVPPGWSGINGKLSESRYTGKGPRQGEVEDEFFLVRVFKNGNCHVWFKRDDLLEKVNKLLAEYYGEVIPDGMVPEDDGGLFTPKTSLAKNYGFFPTPDKAAETVVEDALLYRHDPLAKRLTVLEPSAGGGALARACALAGAWVDCVEIQPALVTALRAEGIYSRVHSADFLSLEPGTLGLFDRVVMNPPFDRERDIDHVVHALGFLKPDGFLTAIMSAGTEFRETRKSVAFRAMIEKLNGKFRDLPAGSFSSVGTNVNTLYLRVFKDGRSFY